MTEVILGSLAALAIRDIVYEAVNRYNQYRRNKEYDVFAHYLEDLGADDE
jgi:hypothetical protein